LLDFVRLLAKFGSGATQNHMINTVFVFWNGQCLVATSLKKQLCCQAKDRICNILPIIVALPHGIPFGFRLG
jgi:hypothetical protein